MIWNFLKKIPGLDWVIPFSGVILVCLSIICLIHTHLTGSIIWQLALWTAFAGGYAMIANSLEITKWILSRPEKTGGGSTMKGVGMILVTVLLALAVPVYSSDASASKAKSPTPEEIALRKTQISLALQTLDEHKARSRKLNEIFHSTCTNDFNYAEYAVASTYASGLKDFDEDLLHQVVKLAVTKERLKICEQLNQIIDDYNKISLQLLLSQRDLIELNRPLH